MAYTTVDKVAGMFPTFQRGISNQRPADVQIQQYVDDIAGEISGAVQRRFSQAIGEGGGWTVYSAALSVEALNVLERINRIGAAGELADTFASLGNKSAAELAMRLAVRYRDLMRELNGENERGEVKTQGGAYDFLFDPYAKTGTPRAVLGGVAGGETDSEEDVADEGMSNLFGKFDQRGT